MFINGVNDIGEKFITGVVDTGDRRKLKGINRQYLRLPKSTTAADDDIGTTMKNCIHTHPTHLDQRPLRPPKLNNAVLVCSSFGGLRGLRAFEGPLRRFVAVPVTTSTAVADFGGRSQFCRKLRPLS